LHCAHFASNIVVMVQNDLGKARAVVACGRDWMGLARLGADGVRGVSNVAEAVHIAVASLARPVGRTSARRMWGIAGLVYGAVRGSAYLVGRAIAQATPRATSLEQLGSTRRRAMVSALNGAVGDHLVATGNPLAIPMSLQVRGHAPSGRILVLVHGLGMTPEQWMRDGHDHGEALARDLLFTPVYLRYNTGCRIAMNGQAFSLQLDRLVASWPVAVEQLVIVAHSMGGLVARSACVVSEGSLWRDRLTHLICLGTPHHGAPLERVGSWIDSALGISPYLEPFSRVTQFRSAGISDLRFGNINAPMADEPGAPKSALRRPTGATPLPNGVATFVVAASASTTLVGFQGEWLGDGLVTVSSALGDHQNQRLALNVPLKNRLVVAGANHWDLLSRQDVYAALRGWLA
jgi:pimeloyl-ACP methyl ester carboxylesterase